LTYYPENYFDGVTGLLEQLVLACTDLRHSNQNYREDGFTTSLVKDSVTMNITVDVTGNDGIPSQAAALEISILSPKYPLETVMLTDSDHYSKSAYSLGLGDVSNSSINRKAIYPQNSFEAKIPAYLLDWTSADHRITNTLERRVFELAIQIYAYKLWEGRWNHNEQLVIYHMRNNALPGIPNVIPPEVLEVRDQLIAEIQGLTTPLLVAFDPIPIPDISTIGVENSATELGNAFGGQDPASEGNLSDGLKELLSATNNFGSTGGDSPSASNQQNESPTLETC
jgi:hypothetical protein